MGNTLISGLSAAASTYDKTLAKILPAIFDEQIKEMGIAMYKMKNTTHMLRTIIRQGGIFKPYKVGEELSHQNLNLKVSERELKLYHAVVAMQSDISEFYEKDAFEKIESGYPQNPKHPIEKEILFSIAKTISEDILDSMFFAERDADGSTALTAFDGFFSIINQGIADNLINESNANIFNIEAIEDPANENDYAAYTRVIDFLKYASKKLTTANGTTLLMPRNAAMSVKKAYANKVKAFSDPTWDTVVEAIQAEVMAPKLKITPTPYMGTGNNMILTSIVDAVSMDKNLILGYNYFENRNLIAVNNVQSNVNNVYFQCDFNIGTQIRSFNKNVFCFARGTEQNTPYNLSGDE